MCGDGMALGSGQLYIWQFTKEGEGAVPIVVLRTRRSLRAVHFPPHAAPFLLTAEVCTVPSVSVTYYNLETVNLLNWPRLCW